MFLSETHAHGLPVELFGAKSNARNFINWQFAPASDPLPQTVCVVYVDMAYMHYTCVMHPHIYVCVYIFMYEHIQVEFFDVERTGTKMLSLFLVCDDFLGS